MKELDGVDKLWLAINAYHEARGEPVSGIIAVCHVVLNRAKNRALSVKDVVLQPWQFSWANVMTVEHKPLPAIKDMVSLEKCVLAVDDCIEERSAGDTLSQADHYYAEYIPEPKWVKSMTFICKKGRHLFFKS